MRAYRVGAVGINVSDVDLNGADILGSDQAVGGRAVRGGVRGGVRKRESSTELRDADRLPTPYPPNNIPSLTAKARQWAAAPRGPPRVSP